MAKKLTEEHKKNISEALKKKNKNGPLSGGSVRAKYGEEAETIVGEFNQIKTGAEDLKVQIAALSEASKNSKSKSEKKKLATQKKALREKLKAENEKLRTLKKRAQEIKRVAIAKANLAKANLRVEKLNKNREKLSKVREKAGELQADLNKKYAAESNPEKKKKLLEKMNILESRLSRITETEKRANDTQLDIIKKQSEWESVVSSGGKKENEPQLFLQKLEWKNGDWGGVNLQLLDDTFNDIEAKTDDGLTEILYPEIDRVTKRYESNYGDLSALLLAGFLVFGKLKSKIKEQMKNGFEVGKKTASQELKIEIPKTSNGDIQSIDFDADLSADTLIDDLEKETKTLGKTLFMTGAAAGIAAKFLNDKLKKRADLMIKNLGSGIIPDKINAGRRAVFNKNLDKIQGYVRIEVLDDITCPTCARLAGKTISPTDPWANIGIIHNWCRGFWQGVPIGSTLEISGISALINSRFETVLGTPIINQFKQIKKKP